MKKKDLFEALGINPDGTLQEIERMTYVCPACKGPNAYYKEIHPDTSMNDIVLHCPDCGYEGDDDIKTLKRAKTLTFEIKEINEEERSFLAVASTEDLDRDNDRIMSDGWDLDNFMKNPVIPWSHRYGEPPVAQSVETFVKNKKLYIRPKFATYDEYPFADTIFKLYKGKYLRSFSVGFWPKRYEIVERSKNIRGYDFLENELWEVSACTVPCNPNALVAAKAKGIISDDEIKMFDSTETGLKPVSTNKKQETDEETEVQHPEEESQTESQDTEKRLDDMEDMLKGMCGQLKDILDKINEPEIPDPQSAEGKAQSEENNETETPSLSDEQVADAIKAGIESAAKIIADKISETVKSQVNYHLGVVE